MKKFLKVALLVLFSAFVVLQFFGIDKTDPPVNASETLHAAVAVPADISEIIGRSCNDCHSYTTRYPWYSNIQPAGWFLKDHIDHGRGELNFSVFNTYSAEKKAKKLDEICEQVEASTMPIPSYLWLHGDAALNAGDSQALCDWANREAEALRAVIPARPEIEPALPGQRILN